MNNVNPILGTYLDGDLTDLTVRHGNGPVGARWLFSLPFSVLTQHLVILGASGTGKSITLVRLVASLARAAQENGERLRILFLDAKGSSQEVAIAYRQTLEALGRTVHFWPSIGIDGFSGGPHQIVQRLAGLFDRGESAYHQAETVAMLTLAVNAGNPPATLAELIERCKTGATAARYKASGTQQDLAHQAEAKGFSSSQWNAVVLRLRALEASVHDRFDAKPGNPTLSQLDTAWVSIPGTDGPSASADIAAYLLALVAELATHQDPIPTLVILDEAWGMQNLQPVRESRYGGVRRDSSAAPDCWGGLSELASAAGGALQRRAGLCGVPGRVALARRVRLSRVRGG